MKAIALWAFCLAILLCSGCLDNGMYQATQNCLRDPACKTQLETPGTPLNSTFTAYMQSQSIPAPPVVPAPRYTHCSGSMPEGSSSAEFDCDSY